MSSGKTVELQRLIDRMATGDLSARDELINSACRRLRVIARKELKRFPAVQRWEETDDVLQSACVRIWRALREVTPESVRHFLNLGAMHIRLEILDMFRHYYGPHGLGANQKSAGYLQRSDGNLAQQDAP